MKRQLSWLVIAVIAAAVISLATQSDPPEAPLAPTLSDDWLIRGVGLGHTYEELKASLGRPSSGWDDGSHWKISNWGDFDEVSFSRQPEREVWRVYRLRGPELTHQGQVVLRVGEPWSQRSVLGKPCRDDPKVSVYPIALKSPLNLDGKICRSAQIALFERDGKVGDILLECVKP